MNLLSSNINSNNDNSNNNINFSGILKDTLMYYQTTLRNVGLYTSISIALFTFSKFSFNHSADTNLSVFE